MNLLDSLKWRYATKIFDSTKIVSDTDIHEILEAFRLSASSFWLQPWKMLIVENPEIRAQLRLASWNQSQIVDASHLFVLARIENPGDELVEKYLNDAIKTRGWTRVDLEWYENMMKWFLNSKSVDERNFWATRQVNIALWNLLTFIASKEIDSCPIEWFDPKAYDEILWLKEIWLASSVVLAVWYRSENDKYAYAKKVRFDMKDIVIKI